VVCTGHDYSRPGKPVIDWDEPGAKDALVSALVNDANALLAAFGEVDLEEAAEAVAAALAMLALVAGQDVEPAEGSDGTDGRWRIARKVAPDRVISQVDPQARHTRKSPEARRDGYRAHVAAEPETGIITDEALTKAAGPQNSDAAVAEQFLAAHTAPAADVIGGDDATAPGSGIDDIGCDENGVCEWYGDSAYGTVDFRHAIAEAGHTAVLTKPKPLGSAVEDGFTVDDFTVNEDAGTVSCPAGHTRPISKTRVASFGALCRGCPLREQCTTSKTGRKIVLHQRDNLLRVARHDWAVDPELRDKYRKYRPNVERVVSQIASRGGRRLKLRYRGTVKNHAWLTRRTAGLNLRNLIGRGLTRTAGNWVLAPTGTPDRLKRALPGLDQRRHRLRPAPNGLPVAVSTFRSPPRGHQSVFTARPRRSRPAPNPLFQRPPSGLMPRVSGRPAGCPRSSRRRICPGRPAARRRRPSRCCSGRPTRRDGCS